MDAQQGPLSGFLSYEDAANKVGGKYNQFDAQGNFVQEGTQQKVNATKDFLKFAALAAGGMYGLGGVGAAGTPFAGEALADAGLLSGGGGQTLGSIANLAADADLAGGLIPEFGTNAAADAFMTSAMTPEATAALGATVAAAPEVIGSGNALTTAAAGATAGNTLANAAAAKTLIDPTTGLLLNAAGNVLSNVANQSGIDNARDAITQGGATANTALNTAYQDARGLNAANRTDLGNVFLNQNTNLNNVIGAQAGIFDRTNTALGNIYSNTGKNLQNLYEQQVGYQQPYQDVGRTGTKGLIDNTPYFTHQFDTADMYSGLAPNYNFMLGQGQMANQRLGNMSGGALGGNAMTGLQRYTQDYAGNAYQQAFNNYGKQRSDIYNSLKGMADIGTTSTGQLVNLGNTYGSNMTGLSNNYASNMLGNANTMQGNYNQYGSNLNNAANNYANNLTTNANTGVNASNVYGLNSANLATGLAGALASNATATGANNATALSNLGNTALLGSMIKAT